MVMLVRSTRSIIPNQGYQNRTELSGSTWNRNYIRFGQQQKLSHY